MRLGRIGAGFGLILLGMLLLVLPGPGVLTMAGGLVLLAREFVWARRTLDWFTRRFKVPLEEVETATPAGIPPSL